MATRRTSRQTARRRRLQAQSQTARLTSHSFYCRKLRYEPLEDRRLLALVTVTTLADTVDFNDGVTSLREAIFATNLVSGADTIDFAPLLTASGPATNLLTQGELAITDDLAINGPGANLLTIDASGNDSTPDTKDGMGTRVFNIDDANLSSFLHVSLSGLTLTGGDVIGQGGAIRTFENLSLHDTSLVHNSSSDLGGALYARLSDLRIVPDPGPAQLTIIDSAIAHNQGRLGGGIFVVCESEGSVSIESTIISENQSNSSAGGGYINVARSDLRIRDSRIEGNSANSSGGGLVLRVFQQSQFSLDATTIENNVSRSAGGGIDLRVYEASALFTNSTISGNSAGMSGGGGAYVHATAADVDFDQVTVSNNTTTGSGGGMLVHAFGPPAFTVRHSTITHNSSKANNTSPVVHGGGGIVFGGGPPLVLDHSIVAQNTSLNGVAPDIGAGQSKINASFSLIGNRTGTTLTETMPGVADALGNLIGGPVHGAIDPLLGPLGDNGGPTSTHALLPGSPAINAGDLNVVAGVNGVPLYDQRGEPFGRVFNGRIDIGAFEYQSPSDLNLLVDTLVDESDGDHDIGDLSLREAMKLAGLWPSTDTIRFDHALTAGGPATIVLTSGVLLINDDVSIIGPGADLLTIDASGNDPTPTIDDGLGTRIFDISGEFVVSIRGLTLTGGDSRLRGGAILSKQANLTIQDSVVTGNASREYGGGIYASNGTIVLESTVTSNNLATGQGGPGLGGGGIFVRAADLTIRESIITGNSAQLGGGLYFSDDNPSPAQQLVIVGSTISDNEAFNDGGGMWVRLIGGAMRLERSIVDDNIAGLLQGPGRGGGIYADLTNVSTTISSATIRDNVALAGGGASFRMNGGELLMMDTRVASNRAFGSEGSGGGLRLTGIQVGTGPLSSAVIRTSTIDDNSTTFGTGGGIFTSAVGLTIDSSTVSGNSAGRNGGGIFHGSGSFNVLHSTITANFAGAQGGGGIYLSEGPSASALIENSIVAANRQFRSLPSDILRVPVGTGLSVHYSLISSNIGSGLAESPTGAPDANGNRIGGPVHGVIDPLLGPLAENGGPTMTHALLPGSPAINTGDPAAVPRVVGVPLNDQRGAPYTRVYGGRIDIGAYELQPEPLVGDYNGDGSVDAADYVVWRKFLGTSHDPADGDGSGVVDQPDREIWQANFAQSFQGDAWSALETTFKSVSEAASKPLVASTRASARWAIAKDARVMLIDLLAPRVKRDARVESMEDHVRVGRDERNYREIDEVPLSPARRLHTLDVVFASLGTVARPT